MEARERDHRRVMVQGGRVVVVVVAIKLEAISYDRNPLPTAHQVSEYNIERDILQHNRLSVCVRRVYTEWSAVDAGEEQEACLACHASVVELQCLIYTIGYILFRSVSQVVRSLYICHISGNSKKNLPRRSGYLHLIYMY